MLSRVGDCDRVIDRAIGMAVELRGDLAGRPMRR